MDNSTDYYVYVYIDPRNLEEFYYGKGKGKRKNAHLAEENIDSEKSKRINAIYKAGLKPIIRVIVKGLTEREAYLIEKTLIWKLGRNLTNKSSGHFADKFRPHDTLHTELHGFDFKNGIYYVNVGEGIHRCWEDCMNYNFLSAGQGKKWSDSLKTFEIGDIAVAYLKNHGYVGIGRVRQKAVRILDFRFRGKSLGNLPLKKSKIFDNSDNESSEFLVQIEWIKVVERKNAKWKKNTGLYTSQLIKASLQGQQKTIDFLEKEFEIKFTDLLLAE